MSNKILLPQLVSYLATTTGKSKKQADAFLKAYFNVLTEALVDHDIVKIKDFGTFKVNRVEARKSVDVSTGAETKIPPHYRIVFTPAKSMADKVNEEFAWLEIVELADNLTGEDLDDAGVGESEELGEEMEKEFGEIEPVEPFGPVDPEDPPLDEPEPEDSAVAPQDPSPAAPPDAPAAFDPYALIMEEMAEEENNNDGEFVTRGELENVATKADLKIIARNIKKLRKSVSDCEVTSRERSRSTLLWSLIFCLIFLTGSFFIMYYMLSNKLTEQYGSAPQETSVTAETDDEYAPATVANIPEEQETGEDSMEVPTVMTEGTPDRTSDIKTMDKVTTTRYLTTMAKEHYGNYNFWPYIYLENEAILGHPDRIKPGTTVVIPNIEKYDVDPNNPKDVDKARKLGVEIYRKYAQDN